MKDEVDRQKYPRMPWHDVHCALWGPPCRDIARHFVQRWNYAKVLSLRTILQFCYRFGILVGLMMHFLSEKQSSK